MNRQCLFRGGLRLTSQINEIFNLDTFVKSFISNSIEIFESAFNISWLRQLTFLGLDKISPAKF